MSQGEPAPAADGANNVTFKVFVDDVCKVVTTKPDVPLHDLHSQISQAFYQGSPSVNRSLKLEFLDSEGDRMKLDTQSKLDSAITMSGSLQRPFVHIFGNEEWKGRHKSSQPENRSNPIVPPPEDRGKSRPYLDPLIPSTRKSFFDPQPPTGQSVERGRSTVVKPKRTASMLKDSERSSSEGASDNPSTQPSADTKRANGDVRPHKSELTTVPEAQSSRDIAPQPNAHSGPVKSQTTASMPAGGQSKSAVPSKPLQRPPVSLQKLPSSVPDDSGKGSVAWSIPVRSSGSQAVRAAPRRPPGKVEMVTVSTETDEIEDLIPVTVPAAAVVDPNASGPGSPVPAEGSAECAPPANNGNNSNNEASVDSASPPDDSAGDSSTACESSASDSDSQSSVDSTQSLRRSKATYLRPADSLDIGEGWDPSTFVERPRHPPSIMYPSKRSRLRAISPPCIRWRKYEKSIEGAVGRLSVASRKKQEHPPKTTDPEPGPEPVPEKPPTEEDLKESLKAKILQDIEEKARIWLIESIEERTRQWVEEQKSKLDAVLKDGEQVPWSSPEVARKAAASLQDAGGLRPAPRSMGDKATEESPEARRRRPRETAAPSVAEPIKSIMKSTQKEHASGKRSHKHSNSHSSAPKGSEPSFPTKPRVRIVTGLTKSRSQESLSKLPPIDPRYASVMAAAGYPYLQGYPDPRLAGYRSDRPGYYPAAPEHWGGYPPEMVAAASLPRLFPLRRSSSMASAPVLPGTLGVPMPFFPPPLASDGYSKSRPIKSLSFPGASSGGFGSRPHKSGAVPGWGAHGPGRQGGLQPLPSQSYDRGYQFSRMQGPSGLAKSTPRLARSSSHRHPKGSARGRPEARISIGSYSRPRSNGSRSRSRSKSQAHGRLGQRSQSMSRSRSKSRPRSRSQSGLVPLGRSWSLNSQQPSKESRTLGALQQPPFRLANSWTYDVGR